MTARPLLNELKTCLFCDISQLKNEFISKSKKTECVFCRQRRHLLYKHNQYIYDNFCKARQQKIAKTNIESNDI